MAEPVGHDEALETQLILQDTVDQVAMLDAGGAVDLGRTMRQRLG